MKSFKNTILFIAIFSAAVFGQAKTENWKQLPIQGSEKVFVNLTGTDIYKGDDVYFWLKYEHKAPLTIETIRGKIHTTRSYYLVSRKLKKYSIVEIIYYDAEGNVLKSFSYGHSSENKAYKYNFPIIEGSEIDLALKEIGK